MVEFDVRLVRGFVAVADERSFTRAADRLHVAQPWLSVQIRKFEEQLGFRLFERNRNQAVIPSREAEALLPAARDYLAACERVASRARRIRDRSTAVLRIGAPDFSAEMPMRASIVESFVATHPDHELEVSNAWTVELLKRVRDRELDMAFTVGPHADPATEAMVVARYALWLLGWASDFPDPTRPIPLSALDGREVSIFRRNINAEFHDAIAPVLEAAGVSVAYLPETGLLAILHNAQRSRTLALVGNYMMPSMLPEPLVIVPIVEPSLAFNLNLVRRVGDRTPPVAAMWRCATTMVAG